MQIIKLGSIVTDAASGLKGMLTHLQLEMDRTVFYGFQPKGLNPETRQPVPSTWIVPNRIPSDQIQLMDVDLPIEVLGTEVEDRASGFKGKAVGIVYHLSGCVHIDIQPTGSLEKTGAMIDRHDFDIRRLDGKAVKTFSESEREKDQKAKPSPMPIRLYQPRLPK